MNVRRALAPAHYSGLDRAAGARFITGKLLMPMESRRSNFDPKTVIPDALSASQLLPFVHLAIGSMLSRAGRPGV
jgi:hypothetical protein